MRVVSTCQLPVASLVWQSQPSVWMLTVVCRATFDLAPGESALSAHQEEPPTEDDYWNDDPGRSLRVASDLVPMKPRADVTLVGHAFAKEGTPVRSLMAGIIIGELAKSIEVVCDRFFDQEGALHEGPPFSRMPLVYERAAGGPGTVNPVGMRGAANTYGRIALPNLQPPGLVVTSPADYIAPTGFGPVPPSWPQRLEKLGRMMTSGALPDVTRAPLPEDVDPGFFNHAPRDQQVQLLRDRERIVLENLHPEHPRFATNLASVRPRAIVERKGTSHPLALRCDTLWIDTDRAVATLSWRAQVPLAHREEQGRVLITLENPGQSGARHASNELGKLKLRPPDNVTDTLVPTQRHMIPSPEKVLPFAPAATRDEETTSPGMTFEKQERAATALPFEKAGSANALPFEKPAAHATTTTSPGFEAPSPAGALPFEAAPFTDSPLAGTASFTMGPQAAPNPAPAGPAHIAPAFDASAGMIPPPAIPAIPRPSAAPPPARPSAPFTMGPQAAPNPAPPAAAQINVPPPRSPMWSSADPPAPPIVAPAFVPPPPPPNTGPAQPLTVGQLAAQNEPAPAPPPEPTPAIAVKPAAPAPEPAKPAQKPETPKALQLLYFEPEILPRLRKKPAFLPLLDALEDRPLDPDLDDPGASTSPAVVEDRRDVFEVLARGEALEEPALEETLNKAVRDDGKFAPPFVLVAGELRFPFDELAALRATVSIAAPFAQGDEGLKTALGEARDYLGLPDLVSTPGLAERFAARIVEAFKKPRKGPTVSANYLEDQVERILVERRSYQKRDVLGRSCIRALLTMATPQKPWPFYIPDHVTMKLPLFARFQVRALVEGCLQEDQFEGHPYALKALGMVRVVPLVHKIGKAQ